MGGNTRFAEKDQWKFAGAEESGAFLADVAYGSVEVHIALSILTNVYPLHSEIECMRHRLRIQVLQCLATLYEKPTDILDSRPASKSYLTTAGWFLSEF